MNRQYKNALAALIIIFIAGTALTSYASEDKHWSYSGDDGPHKWGDLSADYLMCSAGRNQSPIDLTGAVEADL